jgi:Flp pilus assembly protein TadD
MQVLPQFLLLGALGVATIVALVRRRPIAFPGVWFFLILAPTSSLLPIASEVAAEHRMYLPLAALISLIVIGAYVAVERIAPSAEKAVSLRKRWAPAAWVAVAVTVAVLAWETSNRNLAYASVETMMQDNAIARPDNATVQLLYGTQLVRHGKFVEAEAVLRRAVDLPMPPGSDPEPRALMHVYLGTALCAQRKFDEGMAQLRAGLKVFPDLMDAYGFIAEAHLTQGHARDAVAALDEGLARKPDTVPQLVRAAWILATSSDDAVRNGARAVELAERAARLQPPVDVQRLDTLSAAYAETGRFDKAIEAVHQAIDLDAKTGGSPLTSVLNMHLQLYEAKRPVRTSGW